MYLDSWKQENDKQLVTSNFMKSRKIKNKE